jgi:carbon-monoxide dehydrogenase large subunit
MGRPVVAKDVVRFVGETVAIVVSEDRASGADAAELVVVEYDPLPAVIDPEDAVRDEVLLFPEAGTNIGARTRPAPQDENLFEGCDAVVSGTLVSQRMAACPLEPRSAAAEFGDDGRLTAWLSTQTPHQDKQLLGLMLGLDPSQVRVVAPDVGGGFGAKALQTEEIAVCWLARHLGRPMRWTETRSENMVALWHGRAMRLAFSIGGTKAGKVLAYKLEILADCGAYPASGRSCPT